MKLKNYIILLIGLFFMFSVSLQVFADSNVKFISYSNENLEINSMKYYKDMYDKLKDDNIRLEQELQSSKSEIENLKTIVMELSTNANINQEINQFNNHQEGKKNMKISSFLELKSKTDPAFKSMINFPLPREFSFIGIPGEKNNRAFKPKICPPGCIVSG
jgi:hypothetical protein